MRISETEYPRIYEEFANGHFAVQVEGGAFSANSPDMRLEQTIQRSKKGVGGIIGQTKQEGFITEWELDYHEAQNSKSTLFM